MKTKKILSQHIIYLNQQQMKKAALTFVLILSACIYLMAQAPQSFNYQAIARDGAETSLPINKYQ